MSDDMEVTQPDTLTLVDEDGDEHEFELADAAEFEDGSYMALIPIPDSSEELLQDSADLIILKVIEEDGEEILEAIEDDAEYERVSAFFMERLKDDFEFEEQ